MKYVCNHYTSYQNHISQGFTIISKNEDPGNITLYYNYYFLAIMVFNGLTFYIFIQSNFFSQQTRII